METVKFLCEFFFGNFWHWLGMFLCLTLVVACISSVFEDITNTFKKK
jgi:hypothetical protein